MSQFLEEQLVLCHCSKAETRVLVQDPAPWLKWNKPARYYPLSVLTHCNEICNPVCIIQRQWVCPAEMSRRQGAKGFPRSALLDYEDGQNSYFSQTGKPQQARKTPESKPQREKHSQDEKDNRKGLSQMMAVMGTARCRSCLCCAAHGLSTNEYPKQPKVLEQSCGFDRIQSKPELEPAAPALGAVHTHQASLGHLCQEKPNMWGCQRPSLFLSLSNPSPWLL